MIKTLASTNVVIVAQKFNPSIINQLWLVKNHIVAEDAFLPGGVSVDMIAQLRTSDFELLILPDRLQFGLMDIAHGQDVINRALAGIVRALPHTPYRGIGSNFVWHIDPQPESIEHASRRLFFRDDNPMYHEFDVPDAQFGGYLSKPVEQALLGVDVKPITSLENNVPVYKLQCSYNFHTDTASESPVDVILAHLSRWDQYRLLAEIIVGSIREA